jgi:hypothetical protein
MLLQKKVHPKCRPATFCSVVPKSRSVTSMVGIGFGVFRLEYEKLAFYCNDWPYLACLIPTWPNKKKF